MVTESWGGYRISRALKVNNSHSACSGVLPLRVSHSSPELREGQGLVGEHRARGAGCKSQDSIRPDSWLAPLPGGTPRPHGHQGVLTFPRAGTSLEFPALALGTVAASPLPPGAAPEHQGAEGALVSAPKALRPPWGRRKQRAKSCRRNAASGRPGGGPCTALRSQQFLVLLGPGSGSPKAAPAGLRALGEGGAPASQPGGTLPPDRHQSCGGPGPGRPRNGPVTAARRWGRGGRAHLAGFGSRLYRCSAGGGRPKVARPDPAPR